MRPARRAIGPAALLAAVAAAALTACGGGDSSPEPRAAVAGAEERRRALADLTPAELTTLFDWAEYKFPSLFPKPSDRWAQPFAYGGETYWVSAYLATGNYLGITPDGRVFGLGNFVGVYDAAVFIGRASDYSALVAADRCSVYPTASGCTTNPPANGSVNECTLPASQGLKAGNRITFTYTKTTYDGGLPFESKDYPVDLSIEGVETFEGQQAFRSVLNTTSTVTNIVNGGAVTIEVEAKVVTFSQAAPGDLLRTLGRTEEGYRGSNLLLHTRSVFNPARVESEFTLRPGESVTFTESGTRTVFAEVGGTDLPRVESFSNPRTVSYEARERLLINGREFDTCRYRISAPCEGSAPGTTCLTWYLVGKGVPIVRESYSGSTRVDRSEFRSGTFLGTPL